MSERTVFINGIPALYDALKKAGREEEARKLVKDFLSSSFASDLDEKVDRFLGLPVGVFPADMGYFRLLWELNQIYISGLYYFTVVAAGVLCERMCYDVLARNLVKVKDGARLCDLIELLAKKGLIKSETKTEMDKIRKKRNSYVHPKKKRMEIKKDAREMIERISKILQNEFRM
jgi:hypothetical protein